jgi:hypothetical protein
MQCDVTSWRVRVTVVVAEPEQYSDTSANEDNSLAET